MNKNKNVIEVGTFNLKYGREPREVQKEIEELVTKHELGVLVVNEATDYWRLLHRIEDYIYFGSRDYPGGDETGILVHRSMNPSHPHFTTLGDGWVTTRGGKHPPTTFPAVTVNGWLRVGGIHLPTPSVWKDGVFNAPPERKDDYIASISKVQQFLGNTRTTDRIVAGDWNESPETKGKYSPNWVAETTDSKIYAPKSKAGHGHIDYVIATKHVQIENIRKDLKIAEGSDHEPVIFTARGVREHR